ncbi:MAG TPA: RNA polymerase sigma factor [Spongiibacteraceae bacterium]|nr:RNA polymerase sigma factor [Spongiibacteraceae bacterium]
MIGRQLLVLMVFFAVEIESAIPKMASSFVLYVMPKLIVDESEQDEPPTQSRVVIPFPRTSGQKVLQTEGEIGERLREIFRENRSNLVRFLKVRLGSDADAQDAAQDAMFRLLQRGDTLRDQELRALLYVTARNIAIDRLRERKRSPLRFGEEITEEILAVTTDEAASPERAVSAREQLVWVRTFLKELPPKCEQAFVCYKFMGLEYGEIAIRMELTESMVRKYVLRALAHCAARLAELEGSK